MSNHVVTKNAVRISYAFLNSPRKNEDGTAGKYGAQLIIPKTDAAVVKQLTEAVEAARALAIEDGVRNAKTFASPIRDGDGQKPRGGEYGPECKGAWVINTSSWNKPGIVDRNVQPIIDPTQIYSGMWCRVDVTFKAFVTKSNSGITCYLNNLQKIRDDAPLGGSAAPAESVFEAVEGEDEFGL